MRIESVVVSRESSGPWTPYQRLENVGAQLPTRLTIGRMRHVGKRLRDRCALGHGHRPSPISHQPLAEGCWPFLLRPGLANYLLQRRDSLQHLEPAVHAQRQHAILDGGVADLASADVLKNQTSQSGCHRHHFVQALTSLQSGAAAQVAALALEERKLADRGVE